MGYWLGYVCDYIFVYRERNIGGVVEVVGDDVHGKSTGSAERCL